MWGRTGKGEGPSTPLTLQHWHFVDQGLSELNSGCNEGLSIGGRTGEGEGPLYPHQPLHPTHALALSRGPGTE